MTFGGLMKRIFVDGKARARMDESRKIVKKAAVAPKPEPGDVAEDGDERKKLIRETMALYREKRAEYEQLDSDLRDKIEKAVREAFGGKKE